MYKKFIGLIILLAMIFSLSACITNKEDKMGDFSLVVTMDKANIRVGDTVEFTVTFRNLSGKNIPIELTDAATYRQADLIEILYTVYPENETAQWDEISIAVSPRSKKTLEKDAVIQRTIHQRFDEAGKFNLASLVCFYMDDDVKDFVATYSKPVKIVVKGKK